MLIFIKNTPRAYAWGSQDALPELLGVAPTGEPQAELWLGDHPGAPASVAKACPSPQSLIELIESDPERYGVDGEHLPFLLKVLAIGAPLSLQVHPNKQQAEAGFAREEAAGIARDARARNYGDDNHKPELLVALSEVTALCGFRPLEAARADLLALAEAAPAGPGRELLHCAADHCAVTVARDDHEARSSYLAWALGADESVAAGVHAIEEALRGDGREFLASRIPAARIRALTELTNTHPGDPGVLISLLLHLVTLQPGEAIYLSARQLHAYLSGIAVEVMAASDNVLRAGFTEKHIDVAEVLRIVDTSTLDTPRIEAREVAPGLVAWAPDVPEFKLLRARVGEPEGLTAHDDFDENSAGDPPGRGSRDSLGSRGFAGYFNEVDSHPLSGRGDRAESVTIRVEYPTVIVVVKGKVRVERVGAELSEVANVGRGQSLYVSAGDDIELSGIAEVFLATVGNGWSGVS